MSRGHGTAWPLRDHIHLFVYGTLLGGGGAEQRAHPQGERGADGVKLLEGCVRVRGAVVRGTLFHLDAYPALVLAGADAVAGEVWRAPADLLPRLDAHEGVADGLFRRVAVDVEGLPCWTYVAGPALARWLTPGRRIASGEWTPAATHRTT